MGESKIIRIIARVSEKKEKGYNLQWTLFMFIFAGFVAVVLWAIIVLVF